MEAIGDSAVRMTARMDSHFTVGIKAFDLEKTQRVIEDRPVENIRKNASSEADSDAEKKSGTYQMDENGIYFEKYDSRGNVILRIPPEVDEKV